MITVFFTDTESVTGEHLDTALAGMPPAVQQRIAAYSHALKRRQRTAGQLLLGLLLPKVRSAGAADAAITTSLAYTGNIAFAAAIQNGRIGADVERIRAVEMGMTEDYFTLNEQAVINNAAHKEQAFYQMWVRKEALLKATGTGLIADLNTIDVARDDMIYNKEQYYLHDFKIGKQYVACVAASRRMNDITVTEVYL